MENQKRKNNLLQKLWSLVTTIVVVIAVLLAVMLVGVRVVGYTPYSVLSGSMMPEYQVGDLVYVRKTNPEKIEVGDVITFVYDKDLTVITHRVTEVNAEERSFTTKGDANSSEDGKPVLYENVIGVVQFAIPALGYLSAYLRTATGRYVGITVLLTLILLLLLPELFRKDNSKNKSGRR